MYLNTLKHLPSAIRSIPNHTYRTTINLSVLETPSDQCRDFKEFKQILSQVILTGFIKDTFAAKRFLQFSINYLSQFIHLDYSYQIFNVIENPDASIYNIMMMTYVKRNYPHRAIPFYKLMLNRNVGPNVYTYPFLVEACTIRESEFEGKQMHNHVFKLGFGSDVHVRSTLVDMYADCTNMEDARQVFDEGHMMGSFVWFSLLEGYIRGGYLEEAEYIYNLMPEKDIIASNLMIVDFERRGFLEKFEKLINEIPESDTYSWSDLIYRYLVREEYELTLELFFRMHARGIMIDELVVKAVLGCCTSYSFFQDINIGKLIHCLVVKIGIECDVELQNKLIRMYSSCTATYLYEEISTCAVLSAQNLFNAVPWFDERSWRSMLNGYLNCGLLENAKALFECMPVKISACSWTAMITYYSEHSCFFESLALFKEMMRSGIRVGEGNFNCLIRCLPYRYGALDLGKCIHAYLIKYGHCLKKFCCLSIGLSRMYRSCGYKVKRDEKDWH